MMHGIVIAIYGMGCFVGGLCLAMVFNSQTYDKGFDDGWAEAKRDDRFRELENVYTSQSVFNEMGEVEGE